LTGGVSVHTGLTSSFGGVTTVSVGTSATSSSFSGLEGHV
jgi:hypothetical protein